MEILTENIVLMKLRHGRIAKWFPITLATTGSLALIAGVFVAFFSVIVSTDDQGSPNVPVHGAVYVGANTCYTCHSEESQDWSLSLHTQLIVNTVVKPAIITKQSSIAAVRQIDLGDMTDPYTPGSTTNPNSQRYIIITETGHTLLNGQWNTTDPKSEAVNPDESSIKCSGCHTTDSVQGRLTFEENALPVAADAGMKSPEWSIQQHVEFVSTLQGRFKVVGAVDEADTRKSRL